MGVAQTRKIALCGVMGALCITVMFCGSLIPCATFCAPALAGFLLLPVSVECGLRLAVVLYIAVGVLAVLLVPEVEMSAIFVGLVGYYPLLKPYLDRVPAGFCRIAVKTVFFNGCIAAVYSVLMLLFPVMFPREEGGLALLLTGATLVLANITFWVYDLAVFTLQRMYMLRFHKRIQRYFTAYGRNH